MGKDFWKSGHRPTLISASLYFDLSFMVWYILGPLAIQIASDLNLDAEDRGLMVATPILSGAILRFFMGLVVDRVSPKFAGIGGQILVILALGAAWKFGIHSLYEALALGVFLGIAGADFSVALPLASQWYPPQHQGQAMGIAGAGNSGTVYAALLAPTLAAIFGWENVFGLAVIPLGITLIIFCVFAKNAPERPAPKSMLSYFKSMTDRDSWWFMFFYCITFGGFVGLASALPGYFHDQYGLSAVTAGYYTAACVFAGSMMRALGGSIADRIGGIKTLFIVYAMTSILVVLASFNLPEAMMALALFIGAMLALGCGNGAVFQLVPQRFRKELGVMTGLIGMAGGIGGFMLAAGLGMVKQVTGGYQVGLWLFASLGFIAWIGLYAVKKRWRTTWGAALTSVRI